MKNKLLIIAILLISTVIYGENMNLDTAIEKAYENNYEILNSKLDSDNLELKKKQAYKSVLPKVDYGGTYVKLKDKMQQETSTGAMVDIPDSDSMYNHSIKISQPIYNGGKMWTAIKIAKISDNMGDYSLQQKKNKIKINVIDSYISILKLKKQVDILTNSLKEIERNYEKLKEFYELDMVTRTSLLDMEYRKIELESNLIALENNLKIAKSNFKDTIGVEDSKEITLSEINLDRKKEEINIEKDLEYASTNNLDIKLLDVNMKIQKEQKEITRASLLPNLNLQFEYKNPQEKSFTLDDSIKFNDWTWQAGVSFNINIWDWGNNLDKLSETENEIEKFKNTKENSEKKIKLGIRSQYYELERLEKLLVSKKRAYESAKENYMLEKEKLDENISTASDFLAAENRLRETEIGINDTKMDYYLAREKYNNLLGKSNNNKKEEMQQKK